MIRTRRERVEMGRVREMEMREDMMMDGAD